MNDHFLQSIDGLFWFTVLLVALVLVQRTLHREIQASLLLLTRHPTLTQALFALMFLPGIFLHESSHFLTAKLLGVRTGRFSIIPQAQPDGKLRLGYVEAASGGVFRDALIGLAPLISGCLFIAYAAIYRMHVLPLWDMLRARQLSLFWLGLRLLPQTSSDFWLWFYLTMVVSSTMLPSASDRRAWLPVGTMLAILIGIALAAGAGEWLWIQLAPLFNAFLRALALLFGLSVVIHLLFILPFALLHKTLAKILHMEIL